MGLFDLFGGSREERETKRIRDLSKKVEEKYGDPATRSRALEQLRDVGTPEAIAALLHRFTVKTEPGITDTEEKDFTLSIVTSFGDVAVGPVKAFIRQQDSVAWGLRCLEALLPAEDVVAAIVDELDKLSREYAREPDKKVTLINHLADHRDARVAAAVSPFLDDASDEVRIAAMQTLVKQDDATSREAMLGCLLHAEAPRVRAAAADALAMLGASAGDQRDAVAARLPKGYAIDEAGLIRKA